MFVYKNGSRYSVQIYPSNTRGYWYHEVELQKYIALAKMGVRVINSEEEIIYILKNPFLPKDELQ